jgi:hypothetical protein
MSQAFSKRKIGIRNFAQKTKLRVCTIFSYSYNRIGKENESVSHGLARLKTTSRIRTIEKCIRLSLKNERKNNEDDMLWLLMMYSTSVEELRLLKECMQYMVLLY